MLKTCTKLLCPTALLGLSLASNNALASDTTSLNLNLTQHPYALTALGIFVVAYLFVMMEEFLHLRKSKPVMIAAGAIWVLVALLAKMQGQQEAATAALSHNFLEYSELFFFLIVAMTYVAALEERQVFQAMRAWLVRKGFSYRTLFWITGFLAFFISPVADNLTTALVMCAVILAVGSNSPKFVALSCINIVVAANAGGAFSPFGDITTLMVWQKGMLPFWSFFKLFIPALVNFVVPAMCMHYAIPKTKPEPLNESISMKVGAKRIIALFLLTISIAVSFFNLLQMPPVIGMMVGMSFLSIFSYYLKAKEDRARKKQNNHTQRSNKNIHSPIDNNDLSGFDVFSLMQKAEWDTLLFFYGVMMCVGGLATLGYLSIASDLIYNSTTFGLSAAQAQTPANIIIGMLSSVIDNIPVMFAVLTMNPVMSEGQWLLVTLTAGVGGSLLSIGSAAGVALMGQARGAYTFMSHLKWIWAVALGYIASIFTHILINSATFG